ncbi:MAG: DUF2683 family protein [Candidatus Diapherotrites archaeon]|nr:DUF2683 family protein [Candidatus Diapherotrites archaeon]
MARSAKTYKGLLVVITYNKAVVLLVQAIIHLSDHENRVLNLVKAKYGLRSKSEVIEFIVNKFEDSLLEPELRPDYKEDLLRVDAGRFRKYSSINTLRRELENV